MLCSDILELILDLQSQQPCTEAGKVGTFTWNSKPQSNGCGDSSPRAWFPVAARGAVLCWGRVSWWVKQKSKELAPASWRFHQRGLGNMEYGGSSSFFSIYRSKIRAWRPSCSSCLSGKTFSKTFTRESLERVGGGEGLFANWDVWPGDANGGRVVWCKNCSIFLELCKRGRNKSTK